MIFKTLFTPGYQHPAPEKRIASIEKLDPSKEADKRILHELAFNDASEKVCLAALAKLDSFVLWMKSLETSHSGIVCKRAEQACLEALDDSSQVNDSLFKAFVTESKNKALLETLLFNNSRLKENEALSLEVLQRLNNEQTARRYFTERANEKQQLSLVSQTIDNKVLNKYAKQTTHDSVKALIADKLKEAEAAKLIPAKVRQKLTLVNARMLALKEGVDYSIVEKEFTALNQEFEALKPDLSYLTEIESGQFTEKYLSLKAKISEKLQALSEQHKVKLALNKTTDELSAVRERLVDIQQQIDLLLEADDSNVESQVKILSSATMSAQEELDLLGSAAQTAAHKQLLSQLNTQVKRLQSNLDDLPSVVVTNKAAQVIIDALSRLKNDNLDKEKLAPDALQAFEQISGEQQKAFAELKSSGATVPESKVAAYSKVRSEVNKLNKKFNDFYKNIERKCENKLKVVDSLIAQGKFKPAISTFYHTQKMVQTLPEPIESLSNKRLAKAFENTSQEVSKLQGWQAYIAQPRKPALLAEASQLAGTPMQDAYERVEKVKQLRAQWQSFGLLHTEEDDKLNREFDEVIEAAFAPCRAFFAELEKLREANAAKARVIIKELNEIDDETPAGDIASLVGSVKSRFNKLGDIDKSEHRKLKRELAKVSKPLNDRVNAFFDDNAKAKQRLIDKADKLSLSEVEGDALKDAAFEAKELQKQWKNIGFAGKAQENVLWQAFREKNDALFARYHEQLSMQQAENDTQLRSVNTKIAEIDKQLSSANLPVDLGFYPQEFEDLNHMVDALDERSKSRVKREVAKLMEAFDKVNVKISAQKENDEMKHLFYFLSEYTNSEQTLTDIDAFNALAKRFKAWVRADLVPLAILQGLSRQELVQVALIIMSNHKKIDENIAEFGDENRRKELQMQLMASKLEGGDTVLPESVLAAWVSKGIVNADEFEGLNILSSLYAN